MKLHIRKKNKILSTKKQQYNTTTSQSSSSSSSRRFSLLVPLLAYFCGWVSATIFFQQSQNLFLDPRSLLGGEKNVGGVKLPILPGNVIMNRSIHMKHFFDKYPSYIHSGGGWIDVNNLPKESISDLRNISVGISQSPTRCGYPKVKDDLPTTDNNNDDLEYCFWDMDQVSKYAMDDFNWEKEQWMWVARAWNSVNVDIIDDCAKHMLGFLDVGVNVGDWISPIRLLVPEIPIYGIEGSPATAAIATANLRTSIEHNKRRNKKNGPSKILPFSLTTQAQTTKIYQQGGVCFAEVIYYPFVNAYNVGGRGVTQSSDCPPPDAAGATTLLHALKGLVRGGTDTDTGTDHHLSPSSSTCSLSSSLSSSSLMVDDWPRIFIMKIDVEGHEFKALSSVLPWLSEKPPCYIMLEYTWEQASSSAVIELLLDVGYDAAWRPREKEFPMDGPPWWDKSINKKTLHQLIGYYIPRQENELIIGFTDMGSCLSKLMQ